MKKLIFLITILLFIGCMSTPVKVENPEKETTIEILQKANDTITYNLVVLEDPHVYYAVNNKTHKVDYKFNNVTDSRDTALLFFLITFIIFWLLFIFTSKD